MAGPFLSTAEADALAMVGLVTTGRTEEASAGGGGRRRGGGRKAARTSARARLSRRERRVVNDALLDRCAPDSSDVKALFNVTARAPVAWAILREPCVRNRSVPVNVNVNINVNVNRMREARVGRKMRALVKEKGAFVRPILSRVEEPIREAAQAGDSLELTLTDPLSRLIAHIVAQFYGNSHRSQRIGAGKGRIIYIGAPATPKPLPAVRLCELVAC